MGSRGIVTANVIIPDSVSTLEENGRTTETYLPLLSEAGERLEARFLVGNSQGRMRDFTTNPDGFTQEAIVFHLNDGSEVQGWIRLGDVDVAPLKMDLVGGVARVNGDCRINVTDMAPAGTMGLENSEG